MVPAMVQTTAMEAASKTGMIASGNSGCRLYRQ